MKILKFENFLKFWIVKCYTDRIGLNVHLYFSTFENKQFVLLQFIDIPLKFGEIMEYDCYIT